MRRVVPIANMPCHFDGEGAKVDRWLQNFEARVVCETPADEAR